ncbi:hypothetical protein [Bailinhaonella thermotolerans]|uniref:Uncharacterized protein n=1 Tax=Bailinhaonella thermotolerans TaxID=1070861 RepID=A0A3A4B263_9ACTN|nr:hypothetical protein [Bailinhaonella thermotolerans]RJL32097.1 hypothetical protein D5H75_16885 [Bailinhaonella thermotolerans]
MVKWAGRIIVFLGLLHLVTTALPNLGHVPSWLAGELWFPRHGIAELTPATGAFWLTLGSFAVPLSLVGALVLAMDRRGVVPPAFTGWTVGLWGTAGALLLEPSPFIVVWVPAAMLITAARRTARTPETAPAA